MTVTLDTMNLARELSLTPVTIDQLSLRKALASFQKGNSKKTSLNSHILSPNFRGVDVMRAELMRALKLTDNYIEFISFIQPRKASEAVWLIFNSDSIRPKPSKRISILTV